MKLIALCIPVLALAACSEPAATAGPGEPTDPIVSAEWLKAHRGDVLLVDMQSKRELFEKGHLDGAVYLDVNELRDENRNLAAVGDLEEKLGALGIRGDTWVVSYDERSGRNATYLWYALHQLGHTRKSVLDGGTKAVADLLVPGKAPEVEAVTYKAFRQPRNVVDTAWVLDRKDSVYLLDVRPIEQFTGEKPKKGYRAGHIPGSHHLPRLRFLRPDGTFVSDEEARRVVRGLPTDVDIVVFCNTFHDGAHLYFQLLRAGRSNLKIWDSGMRDYTADEEKPLELGDGS